MPYAGPAGERSVGSHADLRRFPLGMQTPGDQAPRPEASARVLLFTEHAMRRSRKGDNANHWMLTPERIDA